MYNVRECALSQSISTGEGMVQKWWGTGINQAGIIKHEVYNEENASSKKKVVEGIGYRYNVLPCESMIRKYLQIISG